MEQGKAKLYQILTRHVPENAVHYCLDLWTSIPFHFKLTKKRQSKVGDYRYDPTNGSHSITVNLDLNQYSFLVTYIHEVAHLLTIERNGRKTPPHGAKWKSNFKELMAPMLTDLVFPVDILPLLINHMKNPKASSYSDAALVQALRNYDANCDDLVALSLLDEGDLFEFNKSMYTKLTTRRTRVLCLQEDTSRKYLISKMAMVRKLREQE